MDANDASPAFGATHHVDRSVPIDIGEYGVLNIIVASHGHAGPFEPDIVRPGVETNAHGSPLFPTCGDIKPAVAIHVGQADAVGASRRIIDHVTFPLRLNTLRKKGAEAGTNGSASEERAMRANGDWVLLGQNGDLLIMTVILRSQWWPLKPYLTAISNRLSNP